jgi:cobalt-zinc-cadmium efflux system membrane fusion protein
MNTSTNRFVLVVVVALLVVVAFVMGRVSKTEKPQTATSATPAASLSPSAETEHEHEELPKHVKLTSKAIADARIRTEPTRKNTLAVTISLPGEIATDPDRSARIASPADGKVEEVRFKEGANVKKGDVLAIIRVPELGKVRGAQAAVSMKAKAARANADRLEALLEQRLTSEQAVVDAEAEAHALSVEARALAGELAAMGAGVQNGAPFLLALRSPVDGTIISRDAVVGQPVAANHTLASIANLSEVWFVGRVFEKDLERLKIGVGAEVQLNAYAKERFQGKVDFIGQAIDPVGRTVTARITLANRNDLLRIGLFGMAHVATGEAEAHEPRLLVPRSAVTEIGQKNVVFVKQNDEEFELHEIVLGDGALGKVEVISGLREGEEVVIDGVFTLKSVVLKGTMMEEDE